jgi:hypothetical protein
VGEPVNPELKKVYCYGKEGRVPLFPHHLLFFPGRLADYKIKEILSFCWVGQPMSNPYC